MTNVCGWSRSWSSFCLEPEPVPESAPRPWASVAGVGAAQKKVISSNWMAWAPYDWLYHQFGWLGLHTTGYIIKLDGSGSVRLVISSNWMARAPKDWLYHTIR